MARKIYYIYNPRTLSFERVYPSIGKRISTLVKHLFIGALLSVLIIGGYYYWFGSPRERVLEREKKQMEAQYQLLSRRVDEALEVMYDLQQRDDNMYRVILQAEPISQSVRNAGLSNAQRYKEFSELDDARLVMTTSMKVDQLYRQVYVQCNSMNELVAFAKGEEDRIKHIPAIQPVSNKDLKRTASGYGERIDPFYKTRKFHAGMDFAAATGTPVYASGDGTVKFTGWMSGYGNIVIVNHGYGYETRYAHLSKILTKKGHKVVRGEEIALVGSTGKSTGPHLHYEVRYKGKPQNPINYYFFDLSPEDYDRMIQLADNQGHVMD